MQDATSIPHLGGHGQSFEIYQKVFGVFTTNLLPFTSEHHIQPGLQTRYDKFRYMLRSQRITDHAGVAESWITEGISDRLFNILIQKLIQKKKVASTNWMRPPLRKHALYNLWEALFNSSL